MSTTYYVISWVDHDRPHHAPNPTPEYGIASSKQAAIRLAERVLPPDADYLVTTVYRTVHHGRTPPAERRQRRARQGDALAPPSAVPFAS